LYAGGDLGMFDNWRVRGHVRGCPQCNAEVEAFRSAGHALRGEAHELPREVNWNRLAAEMKANIRVGLAAGQCVGPDPQAVQPAGWRVAVVLASMALVMVSGWWLQLPKPPAAELAHAQGIVLDSTESGVRLQEGEGALTLMNPGSNSVMVSVSMEGSLRARYVDSETGQVTINNVYAQ
jgi:hypothetical protein